ncbi:hypothetical protein [Leifsonia sp. 1010]|uniref:hypothetical protein n=1 Tax=Leifsonia sp. 1010 TaxID=2817769 RepID=UPI0037BF6D7B
MPTSRGSQWRAANVGKMLRRGRYAGVLEHKGVEVPVPTARRLSIVRYWRPRRPYLRTLPER